MASAQNGTEPKADANGHKGMELKADAGALKAADPKDDGLEETAPDSAFYIVATHAVVAGQGLIALSVIAQGLNLLRARLQEGSSGAELALRSLGGLVVGTLRADVISWCTHYFLDNYISSRGILGPLVDEFILHHKLPKFQHQTYVQNAWRECLFTTGIMASATATGLINLKDYTSCMRWGIFGFWGTQISAIHKAAHIPKPPLLYTIGQRIGLIIDRRHHAKHHATLTQNFSLCNGFFEAALEKVYGVEFLEILLYLLLGAAPRNSRLGLKRSEANLRTTLPERFQHLKWAVWYKIFNNFATQEDLGLHFMNWGFRTADGIEHAYPSGTSRVLGKDPRVRAINAASLQLYLHLLQGVPLDGRDVAEVSSGRGGAMACLAASGWGKSWVGVDACANAVETCNELYRDLPNLKYVHGDAVAPLGFQADIIMNVEASHCYPSRETFFRRVHEALKPGGHFLFADFMAKAQADQCVEWLQAEGRFSVEVREDITSSVIRAMEYTNDAKIGLIRERSPRLVHGFLERFAATSGSKSRGDADDGWHDAVYLHLRAKKL